MDHVVLLLLIMKDFLHNQRFITLMI